MRWMECFNEHLERVEMTVVAKLSLVDQMSILCASIIQVDKLDEINGTYGLGVFIGTVPDDVLRDGKYRFVDVYFYGDPVLLS